MSNRVYLDFHSTTPCDPRVLEAMTPYFSEQYGNPSALHIMGSEAKEAVDLAKVQVAQAINANPEEIYFCNGATEANNLILKGRLLNYRRRNVNKNKRVALVSSPVEHGSILKCLESIKKDDHNVDVLWFKVNKDGTVDLEHFEQLLKSYDDFVLGVSLMTANNEIGTIYPVDQVQRLCGQYGVFFHTDATQAVGKMDLDIKQLGVGAVSLSGHKVYGPKGVGALWVADEWAESIDALIDGGYQGTYTSGTQAVPNIVGMGKAYTLLNDLEERARIKMLRDYLLKGLLIIPDVYVNGTMENRLINNINISIKDVSAEALIVGMDDVIVSGGSACKTGSHQVSHVLQAIGAEYAENAIRLSLGRYTTREEIDYAINRISDVVKSIRDKNV